MNDNAVSVKRLRYAELRLWFDDVDPVSDPPSETVGVMQGSLDETQRFASAVLAVHFHGECGCQTLQEKACNCPAELYGYGHAETCPKGLGAGRDAGPAVEIRHEVMSGSDAVILRRRYQPEGKGIIVCHSWMDLIDALAVLK